VSKPLDDVRATLTDRHCKLLQLINDGRLAVRGAFPRAGQAYIWDEEMRGGQQATEEECGLIEWMQDRMLVTRPARDGRTHRAALTAWGRTILKEWVEGPVTPIEVTGSPLADAVIDARKWTVLARDTLARTSTRLTDDERHALAALRVAAAALDEAYRGVVPPC